MNATITSQMTIFLYSILLGSILCLIFDGFRVLNAVLKINLKRIFFEDVFYFILSALITFTYILVVNMGEIRFYIILGEIIGWIIYRISIGKFVYKAALNAVKFLIKWVSKIKNYIILKIPKEKLKKLTGKTEFVKSKFMEVLNIKNFFQKNKRKYKKQIKN